MQQLTFTRFIAAMAVVVFHWSLHTPALRAAIADYRQLLGLATVSYFFVLSGFIMVSVYGKPGRRIVPRDYWALRVARVYPVYLLGLVWMALLLRAGIGDTRHDAAALALNVGMLQAWIPTFALSVNAPGWSLSAEAFFYLLFPLLLGLGARIRRGWVLAAATSIVWLASQILYHWLLIRVISDAPIVGHEFLHHAPIMHLNAFIVGMGAAALLNRHGEAAEKRVGRSLPALVVVLILASCALVIAMARHLDRISQLIGIPLSLTNGLLAPLFALLIVALAVDQSVLARTLKAWPLVMLGEISYSIYILQIPVSWSVRTALTDAYVYGNPVPAFAVYISALIGAAYASYRWFETPIRSAMRRRQASIERARCVS